jgi:DNA invertase Pin-like site-specific DNA recombinase
MKCFVYCRLAPDGSEGGAVSLESQQRQAAGYALMKGWPISERFVDRIGGATPLARRPEGERLLALLQAGDAVIASRLDRLFRNASDALATLQALRELGVSLHVIDLGGDVCSDGPSRPALAILTAVAGGDDERIRERIREVRRHLAAQGVYGGGKRPFGYDIVDKRLVPNALEQAALADMVARRRAGDSYLAIGAAYGKPPMSIKRILARVEVG